ncbi:NAD-dependent epimerase/dehydratase family protein [Nocardioides acrostichi]|uniref:NAD(P)-dependent oxidoreductase n=1 Tax=Nocardioides acrostichi TaxID=2784339 RepID=A0A930UZI8_9ACTN|nr:NAD(P)-dependent oxidoreductase [Nocardioides acrostichi]MBF4162941.1 NAD(P)-dependent oxidoreductase [Nocardioides acrostichi]
MSDLVSDPVVVTGANGLVGSRVCAALLERGAPVRAVVRRPGAAPDLAGVEEVVGDFADPEFAARVVVGAAGVVTTVHPMGSDLATQHAVAVVGTPVLARAARDAGVARFVHLSTAAVYDRSPSAGEVDEAAALVDDDADDYAVTKRDTDTGLGAVEGSTTVLLRPPAILGSGDTSVWNTLRPRAMSTDAAERRAVPDATWAWVHVDDLAALAALVAVGAVRSSDDAGRGPVEGACTALNVAAPRATQRDYVGTVCDALGVEPEWTDEPAWRGSIQTDRARAWGWSPKVDLEQALAELHQGLHQGPRR